jgi:TRAP-type C4-dicarboxylate transport system substrate-binding protein
MARVTSMFGRRAGAVGVALTAWDLWRKLPPEYRRQITTSARKHGPRLAATAAKQYREYRSRIR